MARFDIAYKITERNEGGYANNKADRGGETYAGIARNFWPNWSGWKLVDKAKTYSKSAPLINQYVKRNGIDTAVESFYKQNFWDFNKLDLFNDQQLANNVYDFGVNSGVVKAAKTLQQALKISADGIIGPQTIAAVNGSNAKDLYNTYNGARIEFYNKLAQTPSQHQFLKSWLSRVKPYKSIA